MKISTPKIDARGFQDLLKQAQALAPFYTPEWRADQENDPGLALLKIFLHLQEEVIGHLNRVPEKNFIAFLDMLGLKLLPARSARAWVSFTLTKGATEHVLVPKGTLLSAKGDAGEVIFETQANVLATPAKLHQVYSFDAPNDQIFEHTTAFSNETEFTLFSGTNRQERCLYLGHDDLFNMENPTKIFVNFELTRGSGGSDTLEMAWEYWNGDRWATLTRFEAPETSSPATELINLNDETEYFTQSGTMLLVKGHVGEIAKYEVNNQKNRWIRCRLLNELTALTPVQMPVVDTVRISLNPVEAFPPELAFQNDIPLKLDEVVVKMMAKDDIKISFYSIKFEQTRPQPGDTEISLEYPEGALNPDDILEFDNGIDAIEEGTITEIAADDPKRITLENGLTNAYKFSSLITLQGKKLPQKNEAEIFIFFLEEAPLKEADFLKLDNGTDHAEIHQIEKIEGDKIGLITKLRFEYDRNSEISIYNALRATDTAQTIVTVESVEGFDIQDDSQAALWRLGEKEVADLVSINSDTQLELSRTFERFYLEGDLIKITPKIKPFGDLPQIFDIFYIASDEAFSKKGANITIEILYELNQPPEGTTVKPAVDDLNPIISWEYWNGKSWRGIRVIDTTNKFLDDSGNGDIKFTCPKDIQPIEVNGEEKHWIRARLIDGNYGAPVILDGESFFGAKTSLGFVHFPIISELKIDYENIQEQPQYCFTLNNLNYEDRTQDCILEDRVFEPFKVSQEKFPGLFLGFNEPLIGGPLTLFFNLNEQFLAEDEHVKIGWHYWNGSKWVLINISDETDNLTNIGKIQWVGSKDFQAQQLFGNQAYWLKASVLEGDFPALPLIKNIFLNTTNSLQATVANDEILGSSNGRAGQKFTAQHPLIISLELWIGEPIQPTAEELEKIQVVDGEEPLKIKTDELGEATEIQVKWQEVDDFDDSGSKSRHYTIDRRLGIITFGNGNYGMIPPVGANNIRLSYKYGGGTGGNVAKAAISGLKTTIPFIKELTNNLPADGGSPSETIEEVLVRGPLKIKTGVRAVTPEDFEALARNASRIIARAKCLPNIDENGDETPGWLTVLIIPNSDKAKPEPGSQLKKIVKDYLLAHCSNTVAKPDQLHVREALYTEVTVEASVIPISQETAAEAENQIIKMLNQYIHPLTGGAGQTGWEFGQPICISKIVAQIEAISGVDYVEAVTLKADGEAVTGDLNLDKFTLPYSRDHIINLKFQNS